MALYDTNTFVRTSTLKAQMLVVMDHATEDYATYSGKTDDILIEAESIYAMQKARAKNTITIAQWQKLMRIDSSTHQSLLPWFFTHWKQKGTLSQSFINDTKPQIEAVFDEILKLEAGKLKN